MVLPRTLTAEFIEAVDNLVRDATVLDSTLHSCARQCLEVFSGTNPAQRSPPWAEHVHKISPSWTMFTTPELFDAMYQIADELDLVSGKRYVSAAICVCAERGVSEAGDSRADSEQATRLAEALHRLSSTWVAFVLWPCEFSSHWGALAAGTDV